MLNAVVAAADVDHLLHGIDIPGFREAPVIRNPPSQIWVKTSGGEGRFS